ncbi:MAG: M43 family zinc metalloprotease, partial [Pseudomonadota bacterium]
MKSEKDIFLVGKLTFLILLLLTARSVSFPSRTFGESNRARLLTPADLGAPGGRCGTEAKRREHASDIYRSVSLSDCDLSKSANLESYRPDAVGVIPVWVHVIRDDSGEWGEVSDEMIRGQIERLNEDYRARPGSLGENGVDSMVQFQLAGVTRYNNTRYFQDQDEYDYKSKMQKDPKKYLNIYTNTASYYFGYAYFPAVEAGTVLDGVVIYYEAFAYNTPYMAPYDLGRTTTHEVGHYLGLFHPFEKGYFDWGPPCPSGDKPFCYENGDLICDTNPQEWETYGCPLNAESCGSPDPFRNYMGYSDDDCMMEFTAEQVLRMHCSLKAYRPDLVMLGRKLKVEKTGRGEGEIITSPEGISCGQKCSEYFADGSQMTLTAIPGPGYSFDGWEPNASVAVCQGNEACVIALDRDCQATAAFNSDQDGDGVGDEIENKGPNNGDGNRDAILDSLQKNVATLKNVTGKYITLISTRGTKLSDVRFTNYPQGCTQPLPEKFPFGLLGFTVTGFKPGEATIVHALFYNQTETVNGYFNYGPTVENQEDHFQDFSRAPYNSTTL